MAYQVWVDSFGATFEELKDPVADGIEADFFWISSVDRMSYLGSSHQVTIDATIDFESVYMNDPDEWHADVWTLYQGWSRDVWAPFVDSATSAAGGFSDTLDWPRFTPSLALVGNAGRLTASCPGDLIYRISQREASQTEFLAECTLDP